MFQRRDTARPRAGSRSTASFATLALLAVCAWLGSPLATAGHHHEAGTTPDDDGPCSVCLWQAHQAADLVDAPRTATPATATLETATATRHTPAFEQPRLSARAPPHASA